MAQETNKATGKGQMVSAEGTGTAIKNQPHPSRNNGGKNNGKRKINLFDIVVIVLVVVIIAVVMGGTQLRSLFRLSPDSTACTVEYMVMFADVDEDLAYAVVNGNAVYHTDTKAAMGTVSADPEVQSHRLVVYADGETQMKDKPGAVDVIITIRASAEYVEGVGYTIGGTPLRVGGTVSLRFPGYRGVGSCINISVQAAGAVD